MKTMNTSKLTIDIHVLLQKLRNNKLGVGSLQSLKIMKVIILFSLIPIVFSFLALKPQRLCSSKNSKSLLMNIPSTQPLQYIQIPVLVEGAFDALRDATVPINIDTAIAIVIAELIAGVVGGLASRGIAGAIGDKKRDNALLKGASSGVFFGARSLLRISFALLGVPKPVALALAAILSTLASEIIKVAGRFLSEKGIQEIDLMHLEDFITTNLKEKETITFSEISGDVTKWIVFDSLLSGSYVIAPGKDDFIGQIFWHFAIGAMASVVGTVIQELSDSRSEIRNRLPSTRVVSKSKSKSTATIDGTHIDTDTDIDGSEAPVGIWIEKLRRSSIEGGVLFSGSLEALKMIIPDTVGDQKFLFGKFLEEIEDEANSILE
eukprot:gene12616-26565_t